MNARAHNPPRAPTCTESLHIQIQPPRSAKLDCDDILINLVSLTILTYNYLDFDFIYTCIFPENKYLISIRAIQTSFLLKLYFSRLRPHNFGFSHVDGKVDT